ncbi:LuxR C-terminal-related transcriptional regulator [Hoyosella altamirensis]|uniref:DNA-binding CsgD family transcriptional regulator n=1 Tax=Hoyosella altamirensis TaxID=616997 RepID=A0A839RSR7_9ACTN|nr:LuxR C-terminal-related transcriptional regulator [Hoyosella altamirensis]MBB3039610.1 DNA-binding CsgD family transcriptional regulator [Hoyosella altamirensis]
MHESISELLEAIRKSGGRPVHRIILGTAGSGKTSALRIARSAFEATGARVTTSLENVGAIDAVAGSVLLVDDVHRCGPTALADLEAIMRRRDTSVLLTARPRSSRHKIDRLLSTSGSSALTLGAMTSPKVAQRARETLGHDLRRDHIAAIMAITGGQPDGVHEVLTMLQHGRAVLPDAARVIDEAGQAWVSRRFAELPALVQQAVAAAEFATAAPIVAETLGVSPDEAAELLDEARDSGLLLDHDKVTAQLKACFAEQLGPSKLAQLRSRAASALASSHTLTTAAAIMFAQYHVVNPQVASYLIRASERCSDTDPSQAATLLDAAYAAGASLADFALQRAEVAARTSDYGGALHFADAVTNRALSTDGRQCADLADAIRISATVATSRGMVAHAADLYRWLGADRAGADAPIAAIVLYAAGDGETARAVLQHAASTIPTTYAQGLRLLAEGIGTSMSGSGKSSIAMLSRAVSMLSPPPVRRAMPDHAAALAATAALHCGDLAAAESILAASLADHRPEAAVTARLQLLSAWASMLAGDIPAATARLRAATARPLPSARDRLFEYGLRAGLARRADNAAELNACWTAARPVIAACSADLFSLLPIGELWIASAHLSLQPEVTHLIDQAGTVLEDLGSPILWAAPFHWCGVQAAIIGDKPDDLVPHAHHLGAAAHASEYAAALATAGKSWIRVLAREFNPADVEASARGLAGAGHSWDGARLAAEGGFRSNDPRAAASLLQLARTLKLTGAAGAMAPDPASGPAAPASRVPGGLSVREAEIASLVVQGFPYREIGERLFIAPKTVEHHVARIRQRIGAQSRGEMLSMLRSMGFPQVNHQA